VKTDGASREDTYAYWLAWVEANLGRNARLASIAAGAAAEAASHEAGFNAAVDAARSAWAEAAGGQQPARWTGRPPWTILAAMGIAISGAAVGSALNLWFANTALPGKQFGIFELGLVAVNGWFLYAMWRGAQWAWRAVYVLVVLGILFDAVGVVLLPYVYADFGALYLIWLLAPNADWLGSLVHLWPWMHLVAIQVPILVLLQAGPSRRWIGLDSPASAHP
jgi:hypothetical protein